MIKRSAWERRELQMRNLAELRSPTGEALYPCPEFVRASGECVCEKCGELYYDHPQHMPHHWLNVICTGLIVKL